jgi:DNA-binding HxlR family transcriptional regulator
MARRVNMASVPCPVARSADVIGDRWSLLLVRDAFDGIRRFSEFQRSLGISKGILAARLREMTDHGIFRSVPGADDGAYLEYELTEKGRDLFQVIVALRQWSEDHCFGPGEAHSVLLETKTNSQLRRLRVLGRDGKPLTPAQTHVKKVGRGHP